MTTLACPKLPHLLEEVVVASVERLSSSFVRVELAAPALAHFGVDGPTYDQRIKLIFPPASGPTVSLAGAEDGWLREWLARPAVERGHMRTYTLRDVRGTGEDTRLVVDFVLHEQACCSGPGSGWAARARVGDRVVTMCPRAGRPFGGIEFLPGMAESLVIAGDETAVPAACAVLGQLPAHARGAAFLEVPHPDDVQDVAHPAGVEVTWLPRGARVHGELMHAAVVEHLGVAGRGLEVAEEEVDADLWETPTYSSSGAAVSGDAPPAGNRYCWIAGEAKVVTGLRRVLVDELGVERRQVAFMGYWRRGLPMRA